MKYRNISTEVLDAPKSTASSAYFMIWDVSAGGTHKREKRLATGNYYYEW